MIGLPAVRVRGMNLAIATLAAATVVEELVLKWSWFSGGLGGASVPRPRLFGIDLGIGAAGSAFPRPAFGVLCLVVLVAAAVAVANLRRGATGLRWLGVRANERAAVRAPRSTCAAPSSSPSRCRASSPGSAGRCSPTSTTRCR